MDATFAGLPSLTFDAVWVPDSDSNALAKSGDSRYFLMEAYKHLKVIGLSGAARDLKKQFSPVDDKTEDGVVEGNQADDTLLNAFIKEMKRHRIWSRSQKALLVPA